MAEAVQAHVSVTLNERIDALIREMCSKRCHASNQYLCPPRHDVLGTLLEYLDKTSFILDPYGARGEWRTILSDLGYTICSTDQRREVEHFIDHETFDGEPLDACLPDKAIDRFQCDKYSTLLINYPFDFIGDDMKDQENMDTTLTEAVRKFPGNRMVYIGMKRMGTLRPFRGSETSPYWDIVFEKEYLRNNHNDPTIGPNDGLFLRVYKRTVPIEDQFEYIPEE